MIKGKESNLKHNIRIIVLMFLVGVATYQLTAMDICDSVKGDYILVEKENTLGMFGKCVKKPNITFNGKNQFNYSNFNINVTEFNIN